MSPTWTVAPMSGSSSRGKNSGVLAQLAAFLGVSLVVIATPGQDTALTIRNTLLGGRRSGVFTAAGVSVGQACWTLAASAGLAALLRASEPAFLALRLAGAAYLDGLRDGAKLQHKVETRRLVHEQLDLSGHGAAEAFVLRDQLVEAGREVRDGVVAALVPRHCARDIGPRVGDCDLSLGYGCAGRIEDRANHRCVHRLRSGGDTGQKKSERAANKKATNHRHG